MGILDKPEDSESNYRVNACDSGMTHSLAETLSSLKRATKSFKSWPSLLFLCCGSCLCVLMHVCAVVCASGWRPEDNLRYHSQEGHPLPLKQGLLFSFNSPNRLDWLAWGPWILMSPSPQSWDPKSRATWPGTFTWVLETNKLQVSAKQGIYNHFLLSFL